MNLHLPTHYHGYTAELEATKRPAPSCPAGLRAPLQPRLQGNDQASNQRGCGAIGAKENSNKCFFSTGPGSALTTQSQTQQVLSEVLPSAKQPSQQSPGRSREAAQGDPEGHSCRRAENTMALEAQRLKRPHKDGHGAPSKTLHNNTVTQLPSRRLAVTTSGFPSTQLTRV